MGNKDDFIKDLEQCLKNKLNWKLCHIKLEELSQGHSDQWNMLLAATAQ